MNTDDEPIKVRLSRRPRPMVDVVTAIRSQKTHDGWKHYAEIAPLQDLIDQGRMVDPQTRVADVVQQLADMREHYYLVPRPLDVEVYWGDSTDEVKALYAAGQRIGELEDALTRIRLSQCPCRCLS